MIRFTSQLVNSVHVNWVSWMLFVYRQILRAAVNLSGAGKNNFYIRVVQPTCLQNMELRNGVHVYGGQRNGHRIEVACLTGKIKTEVALFAQRGHRLNIA